MVFTSRVGSLYPTMQDMKQSALPIIRGTALGAFFGVLPGTGPAIASFAGRGASACWGERVSRSTTKAFGWGSDAPASTAGGASVELMGCARASLGGTASHGVTTANRKRLSLTHHPLGRKLRTRRTFAK